MITAETVNGIVRFPANGLPVVSLYCRVDPGASQREVRARVDSLLDQIRPLAKERDLDHRYRLSVRADIERIKDALGRERWPPGTIAIFSCSGRDLYEEIPLPRRVREQVMVDATPLARPMLAVLGEYYRSCVLVVNREEAPVWEMYQDEMREVETVTDPLRKAGNTGTRAEDRIQNRMDEQAKRHIRRVAQVIDQLLRTDEHDVLVVGGHEYKLADFLRLLPHQLRGRVAGTFWADPAATPVAEIRRSAQGVVRRYQREQDQRLVDQVLELAAAGGLAALGPEDCLWAGSMSAIDTLLVRDGTTLLGVLCDESRWPGRRRTRLAMATSKVLSPRCSAYPIASELAGLMMCGPPPLASMGIFPAQEDASMAVQTDPHLSLVRPVTPRTPEGCEECLILGSTWVHLRLCLTCGHVGCCDSSPLRHARAHAFAIGHPIVQSFEPGENWRWCYVDETYV